MFVEGEVIFAAVGAGRPLEAAIGVRRREADEAVPGIQGAAVVGAVGGGDLVDGVQEAREGGRVFAQPFGC